MAKPHMETNSHNLIYITQNNIKNIKIFIYSYMIFNINNLLDKILFEINPLNPIFCREWDDPRIDTYYISINENNYIVLDGVCEQCDNIAIYNNNNLKYNIMTRQGLNNFVNKYGEQMDDSCNIIFELDLNNFNGNINDLILILTNTIKKIVSF